MRVKLIKIAVLTMFLLACDRTISAQEKSIAYEVPEKNIALWLLNDLASPVQIRGPKRVFGFNNGAVRFGYELQNVSDANVQAVYLQEADWVGSTRLSAGFDASPNNGFFIMAYGLENTFQNHRYDVRPFEEKTGKEVKFLNWRNRIWVAMVVKVKLSNGKVFDNSEKFEKFEKFLDQLYEEQYLENDESKSRSEEEIADEFAIREAKLKEFISKMQLVIN